MIITKYDGFNVYSEEETNSFIYTDFYDKDKLITGLTDFLFSDENVLNYTNKAVHMELDDTDPECWAQLYRNISLFLNSRIEELVVGAVDDEILDILKSEYVLIAKNGELAVQKDKVGKIGEYAFHVLLSSYFGLSCILPKVKCSTDRNMSVFGIDTLFLDIDNRTIYFGESKFSKDLDGGIKLANRSFQEYEQQIKEEYRFVLSQEDAFSLSDSFVSLFGNETKKCISFEKFVTQAGITKIGIPVFIAHGKYNDKDTPESYVKKMKEKIIKSTFFGLPTQYILISLPVIDKSEFIKTAMEKVVKKQHEYEAQCI